MNRNIETIQSIYQAFGRGDVPHILAQLSPKVEWDVWPDLSAQRAGHPLLLQRTNPAGVGEFFQVLAATLEFHEFKLHDIFGSGHRVAALSCVDCTYRATGVRLRDEELHLWTFGDDGRVIGFRHYIDTAKHMRGAGLLAA
ncbi:MAG TPA: nuclear transport factor 2 family protein [Ramlibacter sp.]|uniref:nuclear transport factor 2 family protein n=1 Tax=Ramlibacter sp. TaxID=1917967 RepID=UPI002B86A226|nr:nuclear transport factor 2 family protein [Ramlibacter sp.]HVZ43793.1 nuclear transport factor 2 family protein [Ramlibacter sp.]